MEKSTNNTEETYKAVVKANIVTAFYATIENLGREIELTTTPHTDGADGIDRVYLSDTVSGAVTKASRVNFTNKCKYYLYRVNINVNDVNFVSSEMVAKCTNATGAKVLDECWYLDSIEAELCSKINVVFGTQTSHLVA